jgi:hypothetical protein
MVNAGFFKGVVGRILHCFERLEDYDIVPNLHAGHFR